MLIVTEHLIKVANNMEQRVHKLDIQIEHLNKAIYDLDIIWSGTKDCKNLANESTRFDLIRCRDRLCEIRRKSVELAEVIYISLNYYVKWDEKNASYCYEDSLIYKERSKGVMDLTGIKSVLEDVLKN